MELGFNFKTKQIDSMSNYEVRNYFFDYENDFLNRDLSYGVAALEDLFRSMAHELKEESNFHFILTVNCNDFLEYEDYFTLFSAFTFAITNLNPKPNKNGYLSVQEPFRDRIVGAQYSVLKMFNNDYSLGTIQLTIVDGKDTEVKWISNKS